MNLIDRVFIMFNSIKNNNLTLLTANDSTSASVCMLTTTTTTTMMMTSNRALQSTQSKRWTSATLVNVHVEYVYIHYQFVMRCCLLFSAASWTCPRCSLVNFVLFFVFCFLFFVFCFCVYFHLKIISRFVTLLFIIVIVMCFV